MHTTDGPPYVVADHALDSEENLGKLATTHLKWITRVPATVHEAQSALAQAAPQTMLPLTEGYCDHMLTSTYGGVTPRWVLIDSEHPQHQAQRTVDTHLLTRSDKDINAFKTLCGTAFACEAEARQTLATFAQGVQATFLSESTIGPTPRDGMRGRPGQGAPPTHVVYHIAGALASRCAARQALMEQQSCVVLATNALDDTP